MTTLFSGVGIPFSLDLFIFIAFLVLTLVVGLSVKRHIKTIQDYALGGRNFSNLTLVATIVATWFGGGNITYWPSMYYSKGLGIIIAKMGAPLCMLLMGRVMAVRMRALPSHLSPADALGSIYGKKIRLIASISGAIVELGIIAAQFRVITQVVALIVGKQDERLTILAAVMVILYSSWGGIRAVTFTDVVQFFTFGTFIPILAILVWKNLQDPAQVVETLRHDPKLQLGELVGWNVNFVNTLLLMLYYTIHGVVPDMFQRLSLARSPEQAKKSFTYAAFLAFLITALMAWVSVLLLADNPHLAPEEVLPYFVANYSYPGFKGMLTAGIVAMAMSTADSCINAASVLFTHDFATPLGFKKPIATARLSSLVMGLLALLLALYEHDLLSLLLLTSSFYLPIVGVPLWLALFSFRTSERAVFIAMTTGLATVIVWRSFLTFTGVDSVMPATFVSFLALFSAHYLLREPGGWQQIDPDSPLARSRAARREAWQKRKEAIKNFSLYHYLQQLLPHQEGIFSLLGLYAMAATYMGLYAIERVDIAAYEGIYTGIYKTVLWLITAFITYPVWPLKSKRFMTFFWPLGMATILLFTGALLVILSHFHPLQLFVLLANFLLVALLLRWPTALVLAFSSSSLAGLFFVQYTGEALHWEELGSLQFRFIYGAFIFLGLLLAFFAYQEAFKRLGKRNEALQTRDKDGQQSLVQLATEKQATLAALQHTGASELLTITKDLQTLPIKEEGKALLASLQNRLLPIAFHLQGIDTRSQDYLRLKISKLLLKRWCREIKEQVTQKGVELTIYCRHNSRADEINGDEHQLTSLIVRSMVVLSTQVEDLEDKPSILFRLEDTYLNYSLDDVYTGYVKQVPAVRLAITVSDDLPAVRDSYSPDLNGANPMASITTQDLARLAGSRIIKSHYGFAEVTDDTLIYVIPVDISEVRPRDMDKAYMEVDATPKRSDDHFVGEGIDAEAQEIAFLADVSARSEANLDRIKMALELIKWYHGPSERKSGEPFYLHPLTVSHIVLDYDQNEATIIGALLHDTVEDTPMQLEHIEAMFGKDTAEVVDLVTHLQSIPGSIYKIKMSASENLQMLDRTASTKGLYVKIADRMHNMQTIKGHSKVSKRELIARETMDFFVPLAEKLGLKKAAEELRKLCLEVLTSNL